MPPAADVDGVLGDDAGRLLRSLLARCTFDEPGTAVTCAVSGGADSLALLALACHHGLVVTAAHVDHGLRPGSAAEAEVVAAAASRFGARFEAHRVSVGAGPNLEARARRARYEVLPPGVLTGHTMDDQAETVLLNLLRGAGLSGAGGMRPTPRRPILGLRRRETEAVCLVLGLSPVVDPSNGDPRHRRNRVRHEVLPLLHEIADRDVVPLLARSADQFRTGADHLDAEAARLDPTDARALASAPPALSSMAIRAWLREGVPERHPPDAATIDRVLAVARNEATATEVGAGRSVRRRAGRLVLEGPRQPDGTGPDGAVRRLR